jgi:hypothetical protein
MSKVMFLFWCMIAIFIMVPITNIIVQEWVSEDGILEQTFNASDLSSWNASGQLLTANQTARIPLNGLENTVLQLYVPSMIVFFIIIVLYVLGKWNESKQRGY